VTTSIFNMTYMLDFDNSPFYHFDSHTPLSEENVTSLTFDSVSPPHPDSEQKFKVSFHNF